ncbi:hypothetical protein Ae201684P_012059 [Aphanomyces euteiches]|uniref:Secreted protein n=1 Tax=Aphanomyces euteiches TaxID=100861 RepID=A0A6G0W5L8_9STRA|nr:hypothetical protein Ae201684_018934 [Aphanomyces euteiches]KAH9081086.1 hypothetical protein Ae201684P_012059 [Aphanomyces euteiches]
MAIKQTCMSTRCVWTRSSVLCSILAVTGANHTSAISLCLKSCEKKAELPLKQFKGAHRTVQKGLRAYVVAFQPSAIKSLSCLSPQPNVIDMYTTTPNYTVFRPVMY